MFFLAIAAIIGDTHGIFLIILTSERTIVSNLKKKRRLKMNKHKRSKRAKLNRHKKRQWGC